MRTGHGEAGAALGAWALDALPAEEALGVEAHLEVCAACAAEAERLRRAAAWLGTSEPVPAAGALRGAVLAAARARRPPASIARPGAAVGPYAVAVVRLEQLLRDLTPAQWRLRALRDWSVRDLIQHLTDNDARLAGQLAPVGAGAAPGGPRGRPGAGRDAAGQALAAWRGQADSILRRATADGTGGLDRPIRLDGPDPSPQPVRHALVQRMFETWIHADDVRVALGRPTEPPPPAHAAAIAALGIRLLPAALRQAGVVHPGRSARLVLTNPDGDWIVPLGPTAHGGATAPAGPAGAQAPRTADVTIITDTVEFGRLMAGRRDATTLAGTVDGDRRLAAELLGVVATLGCGH